MNADWIEVKTVNIRRCILFVSVFMIFGLGSAKNSPAFEHVLRLSDGTIINAKQMIEDMRGSSLIFVGEIHDNLQHHKAQLFIIKAMNEQHIPTAIGLEMFRATSQKELDQWVDGAMSMGDFVRVYSANWGMPWPWYMNILQYARLSDIPLIGLNVSSEITEKVSKNGMASLSQDDLKQLPPSMTFEDDEKSLAQMRKVYDAHKKSDATFQNFYKAQQIWDKTMAYHLMNYLKRNPDRTVVVLAGIDHAGKRGIPEQMRRQTRYRYTVILPEVPGRIERNSVTVEDADYLVLE
jgi:uncharacterized iron-regulated protein